MTKELSKVLAAPQTYRAVKPSAKSELAATRERIAQLEKEVAQAKAKARTPEDVKILNAVRRAGGIHMVLAKIPGCKPQAKAMVRYKKPAGLGGKAGEKLAQLKSERNEKRKEYAYGC